MLRITLLLLLFLALTPTARAVMPAELARAARDTGMPLDAVEELEQQAVAWLYEPETEKRQITVVGLVKIGASRSAILEALKSDNGILVTNAVREVGIFANPPRPADVAGYRLPESDLEALADCEIGACKFKLGAQGVERFGEIDWSAPDARNQADDLARQGLVRLVTRYQQDGHENLGVFADKEKRVRVAEGIDQLLNQFGRSPDWRKIQNHLKDYPKNELPGTQDRMLWTVRDYGYRPVTGVLHVVVYEPERPDANPLIALKNLYASHYFHGRLQLIELYPDADDPGATYLAYVDRLLFDDDVGSIKRGMLEAGVLRDVAERLEILRNEHR